ncbi:MAG: bifunctional tetrahydrofolate synthase/dihydrofolate synthase, partial [Alcaligenaceae bacterium]|nr:bifunctional tetrahydrofolate synthase/dihydrofolate synthase [Alcaligenaceae bacterium]
LESIHSSSIDLGLERVSKVAQQLDINWSGIKIIVGGTNGKGSTCAMLESIYLAAGYTVGMYTSPHLIHFNERIRLNGEIAQDSQIIHALNLIENNRGGVTLTYFEYTTLAALLLFKQNNVDVAILEVGLGGRLDAVNIVDADCSIITSVNIDHTQWLGNTREEIGFEKAHIFRAGKPAICSDPEPPRSLLNYAEKTGADLWLFGRDFNYSGDKQQWAFAGRSQRRNALAYPALRGANQLLNASAALAAIESLKHRLAVPVQAIREGLLQASLPGRFQILPGQPTIVLDVAHNPHAAAVLAHNLDGMAYFPYTHAVIGMLNDKDCDEVLQKMGRRIDHWYCASLPGERARSGQEIASKISTLFPPDKDGLPTVTVCDTPVSAFESARDKVTDNDRIVVFGSFLTVAAVLQKLNRG